MSFKRNLYRTINRNKPIIQLFKNILIVCCVVIAGAIVMLAVEHQKASGDIKNFFDAIWWSLVTITTVGYGDLVPKTFWGRIIGIVFIFLGFTIFSTFTAFIASSFIDRKIKERKGLNKIKSIYSKPGQKCQSPITKFNVHIFSILRQSKACRK